MGMRGPKPIWPISFDVRLGERIVTSWADEARTTVHTMPAIARQAIDAYFADPEVYIIVPTRFKDEKLVRCAVQVSTPQFNALSARAEILQLSVSRVGAVAIAARYTKVNFAEKRLLIPGP